jgi:uncharacterized membrane protein
MPRMTSTAVRKTVAAGVLTGMRTMAGAAAIAAERGGPLAAVVGLLAAGEMAADKTRFVGNRIDPFPLAGRAVLGAVVGGIIAHEEDGNVLLGGLLGASTAVVAAHLAYHARKRLPLSNVAAGMAEDALVLALASAVAQGG